MAATKSDEYYVGLINELRQLARESEWVEFKHNNSDPDEIGQNVSALANSAALRQQPNGYIVWGIDDATHDVVGTNFNPALARKGNEELENWLLRLLEPRIDVQFVRVEIGGKELSLIEIQAASRQPVRFQGIEHVRVGSYTKKLKDYPEKERQLWQAFDRTPVENQIAADGIDGSDVLMCLKYSSYLKLLGIPPPENRDGILERLASDKMIQRSKAGGWDIFNLGAILFASRLSEFPHLKRKAVRVIEYDGDGRTNTKQREQEGARGYATGFEGLVGYIKNLLPENEVIGEALRRSVPMYPELAIRELAANVIIHQDLAVTGAGPMIEIFDSRIEITNPGEPLVEPNRFLDLPPRSRNEALASFMRRIGVCEERGSGIDKVISQVEAYQLPAPLFETPPGSTRATLFAHRSFSEMSMDDRIRASYQHACLQYVTKRQMTNSTLRERFGIEERNSSQVSRVIRDSVDRGLIKRSDPESGSRKHASYVPYWV